MITDVTESISRGATLIDLNRFISNNNDPLVIDRQAIENMILNIIQTEKGTYPFEPDFGTNLERYLFRLNSGDTLSLIENEILSALTQWMPYARVHPNGISVRQTNNTEIIVNIEARLNQQAEVFRFRLSA